VTTIQVPTHCPSCSSVLEWSNDQLFCRNSGCDSQSQKKIVHFAKTLKIKGLGPASVEKLGFEGVADIYDADIEFLADRLNSRKIAEKLFQEIQNSKKASLNLLLPAMSIPLIGRTATDKLSKCSNGLYEVDAEVCKSAGLGPKQTDSLLGWLELNDDLDLLPHSMEFEKTTNLESTESRGAVCISGKLKSFKTKADATQALSELGYSVKSSLTKEVTILINESGIESAKTKQARQAGITIIENLLDFIGEKHGIA